MAADDITSQDAAVIGDDLVEALGFEPITADAGSGDEQREASTSEVAVLDTSVDDRALDEGVLDEATLDGSSLDRPPGGETFVEPPSGDDIEIIDDDSALAEEDLGESAVSELDAAELDAAELDVTELDEIGGATETDLDPVSDVAEVELELETESDSDLEVPDLETVDLETAEVETAEDELPDQAETSLFGAPAPAYSWNKRTSDEDQSEDTTNDESADEAVLETDLEIDPDTDLETDLERDEVDLDTSADESDDEPSPVVFFNNGVDTDTAPLSDLDLDDTDAEPDTSGLDEVADLDTPELDIPADADEIDLSDPPPPPASPEVTNLIDLDRGDDLAVGDTVADQDTVAVPLQRPALDLPTGRKSDLDVGPTPEPETERALETAETQVEPLSVPSKGRRQKLRARKSRRVVRHIDPWSVLTFSVLFHLCFFAALLLASVLVWNAALAAGTIENIENFIRELGDYETFEINSDQVFKAATLIAGLLTLASSVLVVLLTVVFNLISDLIGGIRVTVIEEETVRIPRKTEK